MKRVCPHCGGEVRLELSVNYMVCTRCCEMLYVNELMRECDFEFGEHEHDDVECARLLDAMSGGDYYDDYTDALSIEAEESMLGRPLFPNEY